LTIPEATTEIAKSGPRPQPHTAGDRPPAASGARTGRARGVALFRPPGARLPQGRIRLHILAVGVLGVAVWPSLSAEAGSVRGRVDVRLALPAPEPRPEPGGLGPPERRGTPDRRTSVVYFDIAPQGAFEEHERPPATLDQRDQTFVPYVLAVMAGTTVRFPNHDRTYHNVFSLSKARRFDLGRYPRGEAKSVRFDRPGVVRVFCEIHSHMSAFILVFAHPYFAATDAEGRYRLERVPPGEYTLAVWTDGDVRARRRVVVPAGEQAVEADFVVE
jgi:plastocyanin